MCALRIGLDFGTSNSGVSVYNGEKLLTLPLDDKNITPEVVKTVIYITNRKCRKRDDGLKNCPQEEDTISNMTKLGIKGIMPDLVLLKVNSRIGHLKKRVAEI